MASLDLRPEWLAIIQHILSTYLPDAEIIAYGSRVTGTAHEGSDLDIVVRNPHKLMMPTHNLGGVRDAFSESNLPILIDILDWSQIPESFREEVERSGVVIFTGSAGKQR